MKVHTNLSIESDLMERAKTAGINISLETERAIKKALNEEHQVKNSDHCMFCGKDGPKAYMDGTKLIKGLMWLCPDEKWICDKCFEEKSQALIYSNN